MRPADMAMPGNRIVDLEFVVTEPSGGGTSAVHRVYVSNDGKTVLKMRLVSSDTFTR